MARWLSLLVFLCTVLVAAPSRGDEARDLFDQAMAARDAGRLAESSELFRRSLASSPRPSTAFNLAVTYVAGGELRRAMALLDEVQAETYGPLGPRQQEEVERLRRAARADLAKVRIVADGHPSATIRVDGVVVETFRAGTRVIAVERVDPGQHVIVVSAVDHKTVERVVQLAGARFSVVHVAVEPSTDERPGTLVLESTDPQGSVEIVGVAKGTGRLERSLPAGAYNIVVGSSEDRVEVPAGRRVRLVVDPDPQSTWSSPWPWLGIGGAVATGITVALVLLLPTTADPVTNPEFPLVEVRSPGLVPVTTW